MYYEHYGLKNPPFRITPDTRLFYTGGNRGAVLEALLYAITEGEGVLKVVGEVGSGKTMLCRMLEVKLPDQVEVVYLANPSISPENILHAIAFELKLPVARDADRLEVMQALQEYLLERHANGHQVVVFVEEAQGMPLGTLEEIRLLSNLETQRDKLLQIVLFGQPELDRNLAEPDIRQLKERITHSFQLGPFTPDDVAQYLRFRMNAAGYRGPDVFSEAAIKAIRRASEGLTRRINILADKSLLSAFAENTHAVLAGHVKTAIQDSEFGRDPSPRNIPWPALTAGFAALSLVLALTMGGWILLQGGQADASGVKALPEEPVAMRTPAPLEPEAPESERPASVSVMPAEIPAPEIQPSVEAQTAQAPVPEPQPVQLAATGPGYVSVVRPLAVGEDPVPDEEPALLPAAEGAIEAVPDPLGERTHEALDETALLVSEPASSVEVSRSVTVEETAPAAPVEAIVAVTEDSEPHALASTTGQSGPLREPAPAEPPAAEATLMVASLEPSTVLEVPSYLHQRLNASREWLATAPKAHYSIQLLMVAIENGEKLESFFQRHEWSEQMDRIYVYRTLIRGQHLYSVMYNEYTGYSEALRDLNRLPWIFRQARPFVRNIGDIEPEESF